MRKHWLYLRYLLRHKWFVFRAGLATGAPVWRLIIHDWSKFLPCEWVPYVNYFYGDKTPDAKCAFDRAWLHHIHRNPHHWNHWILNRDDGKMNVLPMPDHFLREMVADWAGAGRGIAGHWEIAEWAASNQDKIGLHSSADWRRVWDLIYLIKAEVKG